MRFNFIWIVNFLSYQMNIYGSGIQHLFNQIISHHDQFGWHYFKAYGRFIFDTPGNSFRCFMVWFLWHFRRTHTIYSLFKSIKLVQQNNHIHLWIYKKKLTKSLENLMRNKLNLLCAFVFFAMSVSFLNFSFIFISLSQHGSYTYMYISLTYQYTQTCMYIKRINFRTYFVCMCVCVSFFLSFFVKLNEFCHR